MGFPNPNGEAVPPSFLMDIWHQGTEILVEYGWYILFATLLTIYYWPSIRRYLDQSYKIKSEKEYAAKCKKDPDWLQKRQLEMEAARKRMQEELDAKAAQHTEKMKEKEELEAEQRRIAASTSGGQRLGGDNLNRTSATKTLGTSSSSKKSFRPEYNPLMGSGSSGGYRPPRRGCPGGGCG